MPRFSPPLSFPPPLLLSENTHLREPAGESALFWSGLPERLLTIGKRTCASLADDQATGHKQQMFVEFHGPAALEVEMRFHPPLFLSEIQGVR